MERDVTVRIDLNDEEVERLVPIGTGFRVWVAIVTIRGKVTDYAEIVRVVDARNE